MYSKQFLSFLFIFAILVNIAVGAPAKPGSINKRETKDLLHGVTLLAAAAKNGITGLVDGIQDPTNSGSEEDTAKNAHAAGKSVGGALGSALKNALLILVVLVNIGMGAPAISKSINKRQDESALRGFIYGLLAVDQGVKSTLDGIANPQGPGSKEEALGTADAAGAVVGGAIGTGLKNGKLL